VSLTAKRSTRMRLSSNIDSFKVRTVVVPVRVVDGGGLVRIVHCCKHVFPSFCNAVYGVEALGLRLATEPIHAPLLQL